MKGSPVAFVPWPYECGFDLGGLNFVCYCIVVRVIVGVIMYLPVCDLSL